MTLTKMSQYPNPTLKSFIFTCQLTQNSFHFKDPQISDYLKDYVVSESISFSVDIRTLSSEFDSEYSMLEVEEFGSIGSQRFGL